MSLSTTRCTEQGNTSGASSGPGLSSARTIMQDRTLKSRASRYPIEAQVSVRSGTGEVFDALSVNISSSGILLNLSRPVHFDVGEELTLELDLPSDPGKPLSIWGYGKVVRVDEENFAVQLSAGSFFDVQGGLHAGDD